MRRLARGRARCASLKRIRATGATRCHRPRIIAARSASVAGVRLATNERAASASRSAFAAGRVRRSLSRRARRFPRAAPCRASRRRRSAPRGRPSRSSTPRRTAAPSGSHAPFSVCSRWSRRPRRRAPHVGPPASAGPCRRRPYHGLDDAQARLAHRAAFLAVDAEGLEGIEEGNRPGLADRLADHDVAFYQRQLARQRADQQACRVVIVIVPSTRAPPARRTRVRRRRPRVPSGCGRASARPPGFAYPHRPSVARAQ